MWIIPKTLSHFVPDTEGLRLELDEQAWMFAQSVTWRSKFMSKQYWLKRFKKGDYVQHLSGLTLSPSMHDHFVESWTESQEASHVSHFQAPENEKDKKTQGTYGQVSQMQFDFADPDGSSSKTCQDWLPLGCVTSCKTWDKWVTERRLAYSARKKLALLTKGSECSSLRNFPTPEAHTVEKYSLQKDGQKKTQRSRNLTAMAINGELGSWATPQASDYVEGARTAPASNQKCLGRDLNQMENWPTPRAGNPGSRKPGTGGKILAEEARRNWGTPQARDWKGAQGQAYKGGAKDLPAQTEGVPPHNGPPAPEKSSTSGKNHGSPKLNPNWVEQLMGLSTGWTDLGSWETALSPNVQNLHGELYGNN